MSWVAPAVGLGTSLLGKLFGGGGPTAEQKEAQAGLLANMRQGQQISSTLQPYGTGFLDTAKQGIGSSMDYWNKLLSGNRTEMMSAIAPEAARIVAGYEQNKRSLMQFGPRGGGTASMLAAAPYKEQQEINNVWQSLRPQAATQMGQLGLQTGQLGNQTYQNVLNALAGSSQAAADVWGYGQRQQQLQQQAGESWGKFGSAIGSSIADWWKNRGT